MAMIYTAPTTTAERRTLMASYDEWKRVTPRLNSDLSRRIEQQLQRNRTKPLIRVDVSHAEASVILAEAQNVT